MTRSWSDRRTIRGRPALKPASSEAEWKRHEQSCGKPSQRFLSSSVTRGKNLGAVHVSWRFIFSLVSFQASSDCFTGSALLSVSVRTRVRRFSVFLDRFITTEISYSVCADNVQTFTSIGRNVFRNFPATNLAWNIASFLHIPNRLDETLVRS